MWWESCLREDIENGGERQTREQGEMAPEDEDVFVRSVVFVFHMLVLAGVLFAILPSVGAFMPRVCVCA